MAGTGGRGSSGAIKGEKKINKNQFIIVATSIRAVPALPCTGSRWRIPELGLWNGASTFQVKSREFLLKQNVIFSLNQVGAARSEAGASNCKKKKNLKSQNFPAGNPGSASRNGEWSDGTQGRAGRFGGKKSNHGKETKPRENQFLEIGIQNQMGSFLRGKLGFAQTPPYLWNKTLISTDFCFQMDFGVFLGKGKLPKVPEDPRRALPLWSESIPQVPKLFLSFWCGCCKMPLEGAEILKSCWERPGRIPGRPGLTPSMLGSGIFQLCPFRHPFLFQESFSSHPMGLIP